MIYCDSSFLVALFVKGDVFAPMGSALAATFSAPIPLIPLGEVELMTRVHRGLGDKTLDAVQHVAVLRQIEEDIADGILVRKTPAARDHLEEALRLARRHAPVLAVRSLDILHVAAARLFKSKTFASFDRRQRDLAAAAGLRLLPVKL